MQGGNSMMSNEEAKKFVEEEIFPMVQVTNPSAISTLCDDFEALEIALSSGNNTLVFAMANYISQADGLKNGCEIAQRITSKVFDSFN